MTIEAAAPTPILSVRDRGPAHLLMHACLRASAAAPPRSRIARMAAHDPLPLESRAWYADAVADLRVARALQRLGPAWTTFHSLPVGRADADLDHLVVGPGGVFPITTRHPAGRPSWGGPSGQRALGVRRPSVSATQQAGGWEAAGIRMMLAPLGLDDEVVKPVLVMLGSGQGPAGRPRGVQVLQQGRVAGWLRSRPRVLDPAVVAQIVTLIEQPSAWRREVGPLTEDPRPAFRVLQRGVQRAARIRSAWRASAVVVAIGAVALVLEPLEGLLHR